MKIVSTLALCLFSYLAISQSCGWARQGSGAGQDACKSVCNDRNGNIYVSGVFQSSSLNLSGTSLTNYNTDRSSDIFLAKYDGQGNLLWATSYGGGKDDQVYNITCDSAGNVYLAGCYYSNSALFDTITVVRGNAGYGSAIFVAKVAPNGNALWVKSFGNGNGTGGMALDITVSKMGNVFVTGSFFTPTIGFGSISLTNNSITNDDVFLVKFDPNGNAIWGACSGQPANHNGNYGYGVATDSYENVYLTGDFWSSSLKLGTYIFPNNYNITGAFCAKYNSNGAILWAFAPGSGSGSDVATDNNNNVYFNIVADQDLRFGQDTLFHKNPWNFSTFVVKCTTSGQLAWGQFFGGRNFHGNVTSGVLIERNDHVFLETKFNDFIVLGSDTLTSAGDYDLFCAEMDTNGNILASGAYGGTGTELPGGISVDVSNTIYVGGQYDSPSISFNGNVLTNSNDSANACVIKLCSIQTGTKEINRATEGEIVVYPNPGNGTFNVASSSEISELIISDLLGNIICVEKPDARWYTCDIRKNGVFFCQVKNGEGVRRLKIVVEE